MTGEVIPTIIALISTLCLIIIAYKLIDREVKDIWFIFGIIAIIVISGFNLINYNGW